jgi:LysM repeat protein
MTAGFKFIFFSTFLPFVFASVSAQPSEYKMSRQQYIERYSQEAVKEMHAYGIPASITLAQGILESGDGNSPLAKYANNHFGIKCHKGWNGPVFIQDDDEKNECFRKYYSAEESYRDHSLFLKSRKWYEPLFELKISDYKGWAHGLKKAGYATNPKYAELLIRLIEDHELYKYDKLKEIPSYTQQADPSTTVKPEALDLNISLKNNVKFIIARKGDSVFKLAKELELAPWQIFKYNDFGKHATIHEGDVIYLQPKRNKASESFHIVKKGETIRSISQLHAVKMKKLYRYNNLIPGNEPAAGDTLNLRKREK